MRSGQGFETFKPRPALGFLSNIVIIIILIIITLPLAIRLTFAVACCQLLVPVAHTYKHKLFYFTCFSFSTASSTSQPRQSSRICSSDLHLSYFLPVLFRLA